MHCASRLLNASAPPSSASCCSGLILANDWICWAESFCSGSSHMHTQYWATSVPSGSFRLRWARSCCHLGACGTFWMQLSTMVALALGLLMPHWLRKKKPANNRAITRSQITIVRRFFLRGGGWGRGRFRLLLGCGRGGHGGLGVVEVKEMRKPKNGKHAFGHLNAVSGCLWGKH